MVYGAVPMIHFNIDKIENIIKHFEEAGHNNFKVEDYETPGFSKIFYNILISYIDYVNQKVWKLN